MKKASSPPVISPVNKRPFVWSAIFIVGLANIVLGICYAHVHFLPCLTMGIVGGVMVGYSLAMFAYIAAFPATKYVIRHSFIVSGYVTVQWFSSGKGTYTNGTGLDTATRFRYRFVAKIVTAILNKTQWPLKFTVVKL